MYLTLLDCPGIQQYVFGSGRLAENVGGSLLVRDVFTSTLDRALGPASLVFRGGGTALVKSADDIDARAFVARWSGAVRKIAPGLRIEAATVEYAGPLADALARAHAELARRKREQRPDAEFLALPLSVSCAETGLPAVAVDRRPGEAPRPLSVLSLRRTEEGRARMADLEREYARELTGAKQRFTFSRDVGQLGQEIGESHIAVVHADGDRLGQLGVAVAQMGGAGEAAEQLLAELSSKLDEATRSAVGTVIARLVEFCGSADSPFHGSTLPMRPVLVGGDDVTFVAEGRIGLFAAAQYLRAFERSIDIGGERFRLTSSAGVAIVPTHHPFARAYALAAELTASAKSRRQSRGAQGSWLDFQIALAGASADLTTLRRAHYSTVEKGELCWRPWCVSSGVTGDESWEVFSAIVSAFRSKGKDEWSRSKAKLLRDTFEQGPSATERLFQFVQMPALPAVPGHTRLQSGWAGTRTPYYDALEALDYAAGLDAMGAS